MDPRLEDASGPVGWEEESREGSFLLATLLLLHTPTPRHLRVRACRLPHRDPTTFLGPDPALSVSEIARAHLSGGPPAGSFLGTGRVLPLGNRASRSRWPPGRTLEGEEGLRCLHYLPANPLPSEHTGPLWALVRYHTSPLLCLG